jgi:hypothetical protein
MLVLDKCQELAIVESYIINLRKALPLFTAYCVSCPKGSHMIWKSPIYKFVIPNSIDENDEQTFKEILVDVTSSAPTFADPGTTLGAVFKEVEKLLPKKSSPFILDFGAGKLRNTLYLLKKGYNVAAVEYENLQKDTDQGKTMHAEALAFGDRFLQLVFPHDFFTSNLKFHLILLINVCNVMPVPAERLLVINYCREKLEPDGMILWYTQHGDQSYIPKMVEEAKIGDGYYMNKTRRYQTFYREFSTPEIDAMFLANGFRLEKRFVAYNNQARLYKMVGRNPLKDILTADKIREFVKGDEVIPKPKKVGPRTLKESDKPILNEPNNPNIRDEAFYIEALRKLPADKKYATEYHNLIAAIFIKLFTPELANPRLEYEMNDGRKRIDLVMTNDSEHGFFSSLYKTFKITAPYILIECKNYKEDIANEEVDQLAGRFKSHTGRFGILVYRNHANQELLLKRCQDLLGRGTPDYVLCLSDDDIVQLLIRRLNNGSIDEYLHEKMQRLVLG